MKYKSQNNQTSILISTILELIVLFIALITPGNLNILSVFITLILIICYNIIFFTSLNINPMHDCIIKNIFNVILYLYILLYSHKSLLFFILFLPILAYKNKLGYNFNQKLEIIYFVGSQETFETLRHIYYNKNIDLVHIYDTTLINNSHIIYENHHDYLNYILNNKDLNGNQIEILNNSRDIQELFKDLIINNNKTGIINKDFWDNKNVYIICNDANMIISVYQKLIDSGAIITVLTTNTDLLLFNKNIIIEYIDINNLDECAKNISTKSNVMILDLYYINCQNTFIKSYFKIMKFIINIQKEYKNISIFSLISHGLSLESLLFNEARYLCLSGKLFAYKCGVIIDYISNETYQDKYKTFGEYSFTSIDNISNMIAYELPLIINEKITFINNNNINIEKVNNIYKSAKFDIQKYKIVYEIIKEYKQYSQITISNKDTDKNIINSILNGDISGIGSKILSNLNLINI